MKSRNSSPGRDARAEVEDGTYSVLEPGFEEVPYSQPRIPLQADAEKARAVARELAASSSRPPPPRSGIVPRMMPLAKLSKVPSFAFDPRAEPRAARPGESDAPPSSAGGADLFDASAAALAESSALAFAEGANAEDEPSADASPSNEDARASQPDAEPIPLLHPKSAIVGARFARTRTRVYTKTLPFLEAVEGAPSSARAPAPDVIELRPPSSAPSGYETPRAFPAQMVSAPSSSDASWVRAAPREPRVSLAGHDAAPLAKPTRGSSMLLVVAVAVLVAALGVVVALELLARHP